MTKRKKTIAEIFDEGKALDAAVRRATRRASRATATKPRKTSRARRRAA